MDNNYLINIIDNPELLDKVTEEDIEILLKKYPFFSFLHVLFLKKHKLDSSKIDSLISDDDKSTAKLLAKVSYYVPNRTRLFQYIEHLESFYKDYFEQQKSQDLNNSDKLGPQKEEKSKKSLVSNSIRNNDDMKTNSVGYDLLDQLEKLPETGVDKMKGEDIIDDFIENPMSLLSKKKIINKSLDESILFDYNRLKEYPDATFSQTLAKIYFKQCRYDKCLEIIKALYLKYPKKNTYFAEQIEQLQKIINNK